MTREHDERCERGGTFNIWWPFGGGKHDSKAVEWPSHEQCERENKMPICIMQSMGAHVTEVRDDTRS